MLYKRNVREVLERLSDLSARRATDRILARMNVPVPALARYAAETKAGPVEYPDLRERLAFWNEVCSASTDLADDSIPCAYLTELDQGLYTALVGAKDVRFLNDPGWGWVSSMTLPFVEDLREARRFAIDEDGLWWRRYDEQLRLFASGAAGRFGISHFTLINGMNFLVEIRGATKAYLDLADDPEEVRAVFDFAHRLNERIHRHFFDVVGLYEGGTCSNLAQWLPGRSVGESVDPFHLTSPATYEEWGREPVERIFARFDGGIVHLHSNGHHLLEAVSTLKGLRLIALADEPFNPPTYGKLDELASRRGDVPIWVTMPYEAFVPALEARTLPRNVLYNVSGVPDVATANEVMEAIKAY